MAGLNKVQLIGRLGKEPERRGEGEHHSGLGLEGEVPQDRVLHERRAEQRDRLAGQEERGVAHPPARRRGRRSVL